MRGEHIKDLSDPNKEHVLIYAGDHGCYWAENCCGYVAKVYAGVYTREDALLFAGHVGPEKRCEFHDVPEDHIPTLKAKLKKYEEGFWGGMAAKAVKERNRVQAELTDLTGQVEFEREKQKKLWNFCEAVTTIAEIQLKREKIKHEESVEEECHDWCLRCALDHIAAAGRSLQKEK